MRSRTLREGSLGLFIILGLSLFTVVGLWLRGFQAGRQSYRFIAEFDHVAGIQAGANVRYRGVTVGRVESIAPGPNGVDIAITIASSDLLLPSGVTIEVNQGGFIGETAVDILPVEEDLGSLASVAKPLANDCNPSFIICDGDRLSGKLGVSFDQLTRASLQFTRAFSDPALIEDIQALLKNTSGATAEISTLANEISELTESFQGEVSVLSASALTTADSVGRAVETIDGTVARVNRIIDTLDGLVADNRNTIALTLDSVSRLSDELSRSAAALRPVLARADSVLSQTGAAIGQADAIFGQTSEVLGQTGEVLGQTNTTLATINTTISDFDPSDALSDVEVLIGNAVQLSENAAIASEDLRSISSSLNDPETLLQIQFTLDSARTVFENVEKITSDLDDLTGDPAFREDMRRLVDGLSSLVSTTQQLDRQTQLALRLPSLAEEYRSLLPPEARESLAIESLEAIEVPRAIDSAPVTPEATPVPVPLP